MIKRLMRINSQRLSVAPFVSVSLDLSLLLSFSHTLGHLDSFLGAPLEECFILRIWSNKENEKVGKHKRTAGSTTTMGFSYRY